jgi:quercetin dioxygenase-like cupin family protein
MNRIGIALLVAWVVAVAGCAAGSYGRSGHGAHVAHNADALQWTDMPALAGVKMAVLSGDPAKAGDFVARIRIPSGTRIAPHWHPSDENVTVLSGTVKMGLGDVFKEEGATVLAPGGFALMPARVHHFAWCDEEAVIQLNNRGPWKIYYVNPADDPAKKAASSATTP